jgi:hypothetical protein
MKLLNRGNRRVIVFFIIAVTILSIAYYIEVEEARVEIENQKEIEIEIEIETEKQKQEVEYNLPYGTDIEIIEDRLDKSAVEKDGTNVSITYPLSRDNVVTEL